MFRKDLNEVKAILNKTNYIASHYDMKTLISPPVDGSNLLMQLFNALADGLNRYAKLPRAIFIILDNNFVHITHTYEATEKILALIMGQFILTIQGRKDELYSFKSRPLEPKIIWVKPLPRCGSQDTRANFRNQHRVYNRSVKNIIKNYNEIYVANIDEIKPESISLFDSSGTGLNARGVLKFWLGINKVMEKVDYRCIRPSKQVYRNNLEFQMCSCKSFTSYNRFNRN